MGSRLTTLIFLLAMTACLDVQVGKSDGSVTTMAPVTQDVGGVVTAAINHDAARAQQVNASEGSGIVGAAVLFPPGSLTQDITVRLEQGESLLHPDLPTQLGLDPVHRLTEATRAMVVSTDKEIELAAPFAVALPFPPQGTSALTAETPSNLVVVYLAYDKARNRNILGTIPTQEITVLDNRLRFMTKFFGLYQGSYSTQPITDRSERTTSRRILTTTAAATLPGVSWLPVTATRDQSAITIDAEISGMATILSCIAAIVKLPEGDTIVAADLGITPKGKLIVPEKTYGQVRVRVTCSEENGRVSTSPWSELIDLGAAPEAALTTDAMAEQQR